MVELEEIEKLLERDTEPEGLKVEPVGRGKVLLEDGFTPPVEAIVLEGEPELLPVGVMQLVRKVVVVFSGNVIVAVSVAVLVLS